MKALVYRKNWLNLVKLLCVCLLLSMTGKANDTTGIFNGWQTVGPGGGDVRAIAVDPKDKNRLFITTLDGQVYSSTDAGGSWQFLVNFNRPQLVLDNLIIDSRDSNIIYTSGFRGAVDAGGFFKTTDGGVTWKEAKDLKNEAIHSMVQSAFDPNTILVGTIKGVWISRNSGEDWKKIEPSSQDKPFNVDSLAVDPRDGNTIYAGTFHRPYKTTDGGKNWKLIYNGMIDDSDVFTMDVDRQNPDNIFASACSGIYHSTDKGETWTKANGIPSSARRTRDLLQHPSMPNRVYAATTEGFWMSSDYGKSGSWELRTNKELEINSIAVHPDAPDRVYIATNNYGVMISNDGGKSFTVNNGNFSSRMATTIIPDIERPNRLYATTNNTATGGGFIFISNDGGITWQQSTKNLSVIRIVPFAFLQDRKNTDTIYLGTNLGLFRSLDRGVSWTQFTAPPASKSAPVKKAVAKRSVASKNRIAKKVAPKTIAPSSEPAKPEVIKVPVLNEKIVQLVYTEDGKDGLLAATNSGLYRTYDLKNGWEKIPFGNGFSNEVTAIATSKGAPDTIWIGTATSGVIYSTDKGATWQKADVKDDYPISSIAVNPENSSIVYVGTKITFYMTRDGGKKWIRRGGDLPLGNFTSILINPNNPNELFIGSSLDTTGGGVFQSTNGGDTWKRLDQKDKNLPSRRIRTMAFDPKNPNRIFAGTHSGGIFRIERSPVTAADESGSRPRIAGN